jgi:hypothetical protein
MSNDLPSNVSHECYVVEIDGIKQSEHRIFVEALKCGMELKRQYPHSAVKMRDAEDIPPPNGTLSDQSRAVMESVGRPPNRKLSKCKDTRIEASLAGRPIWVKTTLTQSHRHKE